MKQLSAPFKKTLAAGTTTLCYCWQITRHDGAQLGLTNHDNPLTIAGVIFHANSGIDLTALETREGLSPHGPQVSGILGSPHITDEDLRRGLYDDASFTLWLVDWRAPQNRLHLLSGQFGAIRYQGDRFTVTLRPRGQALNQVQGWAYQATCSADLGDKRCGFDVARQPYQWHSQLTRIEGHTLVLPPLPPENGWFRDGHVVIDAQHRFTIREDNASPEARRLTLWEQPPSFLRADDALILQVGCAKNYDTCLKKFNNIINFQGFPTMSEETLLLTIGQ